MVLLLHSAKTAQLSGRLGLLAALRFLVTLTTAQALEYTLAVLRRVMPLVRLLIIHKT